MFFYSWSSLPLRLALGAFLLGGMLLFFGYQEWTLASASSAAPQDLTVDALLARGVEGNSHVRLHDFVLGENFEFTQYEHSADTDVVYIPALPKAADKRAAAAKVIVITNHARNEKEFDQFRARATLSGIVLSGKDLEPEFKRSIAEDYPGTDFNKSILLQEGREPKQASTLVLMIGGGVGLLVVGAGLLSFTFSRKD
jgi:hypothetical protein